MLQAYAALHTGVVRGDASIATMGAMTRASTQMLPDDEHTFNAAQANNLRKVIDGSDLSTRGIPDGVKGSFRILLRKYVEPIYWAEVPKGTT